MLHVNVYLLLYGKDRTLLNVFEIAVVKNNKASQSCKRHSEPLYIFLKWFIRNFVKRLNLKN